MALLTFRELRAWRDGYRRRRSAASVNRMCKTINAALNFVAKQPENFETIKTDRPWKRGLESLPESNVARRGVVQSKEQVRAIVTACYDHSMELGLFVEVLAVTGARTSQVARLLVRDLKSHGVMMPSSKKGKGKKRVDRIGFPLPAGLIAKLRVVSAGRDGEELLLRRDGGGGWTAGTLRYPYAQALKAAKLSHVIPYALRHTSITHALKEGGATIEAIAKSRDTSVRMIETVYGNEIYQVSAPEILNGLIDLDAPDVDNVVAMTARR